MEKERLQIRARVNVLGTKEELVRLLEGDRDVFIDIFNRGDVEFDGDLDEIDPYIPEESANAFCEGNDLELEFGDTVG